MNIISIIGRLTKDPELRYTQSNKAVSSFTLAVRRPRTKDTTDFINCVAWEQSAEYLNKYARKGQLTGVTGNLTVRDYTDKKGEARKAYEVRCDNVEILERREEGRVKEQPGFEELGEDDGELPF